MKLSQQKLRRMIKEELADIAGQEPQEEPAGQEAQEEPGGDIVEFAGGSFKLEWGEVQVHIGVDHVADVPFAAILELAEKVAAAQPPEQEPPGELTVTKSQVDDLERARPTKLQQQDRRWRLGL